MIGVVLQRPSLNQDSAEVHHKIVHEYHKNIANRPHFIA